MEELPKPKLQVYPRVSASPATVIVTLTGIPDNARVACFFVDGPEYASEGCTDPDGRRTIRREERSIPSGNYIAFATVDDKKLPTIPFIVQ